MGCSATWNASRRLQKPLLPSSLPAPKTSPDRVAGPPTTENRPAELSILNAIREALWLEMERDERVVVLGEDVGTLGGVFRVTRGLQERFGPDRVFDTPLAEASIVGASLGLALGGMVPVAEIQFLGFTHQAFHQLGPQLGRYRFRSRGRFHAQVTIRAPFGGGSRTPEFHADALEAQFTQMPGVKVVCPAFPADAKGLLLRAIRDPDPVLYLEPEKLYRSVSGPVPEGDHTTPFGSARLAREGCDLTLVSWSAGVHLCLAAAEALAADGASVAVLDLRSIVPLDVEGLVGAAAASGKVIVVQEAPLTGGFGAELAATIQEEAFPSLDAPVQRIAAPDTPYPPGALEDHYLPSLERLLETARRVLRY
jgi:pyruvate dehydrogenase E1 component beta subunit